MMFYYVAGDSGSQTIALQFFQTALAFKVTHEENKFNKFIILYYPILSYTILYYTSYYFILPSLLVIIRT